MLSNTYYEQYLRECQAGLPVEIILGSPRSENCRDLGVCRIYMEGQLPDSPPCANRLAAYLRLEPHTERLLIHFLSCGVTPDIRRDHFPDDRFRVTDAYRFTPAVCAALRLPAGRSFRIYPGNYPVLDDGHLLTVSARIGERSVATRPQQLLAA